MTSLNIDTVSAPEAIKQKLRELSDAINFDKQSRKGASGWLFFGTNVINQLPVAVKFYDWSGDPEYHAEPRNLASINSENVVKILDAAFVNDEYAYFVTPYYSQGDLDEKISQGVIGNIRGINLVRDLLSGLSFLHAERLLHRDLKPQNLLLSDDDHAVIGDFGSVKKMPHGQTTIPGSGHSLIYRPPESVSAGVYGFEGDLYQVGVVMFQLLGGFLPYEEAAWLNKRELKQYRQTTDYVDKQIFASEVIKRRIRRGKIINLSTLPPWVCRPLKLTIAKACNVDPRKRYQSCAEFLARIGTIRSSIPDWRLVDGHPTRFNNTIYRIVKVAGRSQYGVQKKRGSVWRNDNSFRSTNVPDLIIQIEKRLSQRS